jgi:hypothetical protein
MTFTAAELISNIAFAQELDLIGKQIDDQLSLEQHQGKLVIGAAAGFGTSFLVGYVFWALRGVSLLLSALASIPMWRCFDPLPVLSGFDKKRADVAPDKGGLKEAEDDEKPVQDLFILEQDLASDPKAGRK